MLRKNFYLQTLTSVWKLITLTIKHLEQDSAVVRYLVLKNSGNSEMLSQLNKTLRNR